MEWDIFGEDVVEKKEKRKKKKEARKTKERGEENAWAKLSDSIKHRYYFIRSKFDYFGKILKDSLK